MASPLVPWQDYDGHQTENLIATLLVRTEPGAQRIDGSGGDDGVDVRAPVDDGYRIFEIKRFHSRLTPGQKRNITKSLQTAVQRQADMRRWALVLPLDLSPAEDNWFSKTLAAHATCPIEWIGRTAIEQRLSSNRDLLSIAPGSVEQRAWELLREHDAEQALPAGGTDIELRVVERTSPLLLGVHRARRTTPVIGDVPTHPEPLTRYLLREHDRLLRDWIRQATGSGPGDSMFAVLTGDSSVGKTRALYEALLALVPGWPLVAPQDANELIRVLEAGWARPGTVLWLDEAQRHLDGAMGARAAGLLERTLDTTPGLVAVAALWEKPYWLELTAQGRVPDANAAARRLLTGSRAFRVHVPVHLHPHEQQAFRELAVQPDGHIDQRVEHALMAGAADGRVIQRLTAGPELLDAYLHDELFSPIEHAVVTASVDARRLGHLTAIPAAVLAAGADGYLQSYQRPGNIAEFEAADLPPEELARCTPEMLAMGRPKRWNEHDDMEFVAVSIAFYYAQAARVDDLVATADVRDTILTFYDPGHPRVGGHTWPDGINRGSGRSNLKADERHWQGQAASGDVNAMRILARLAVPDGRYDEARQWLHQAISVNDSGPVGAAAMRDLAQLLQRTGFQSEATQLLRQAADAGDIDACCEILDGHGRSREAEQLLRRALETGDFGAEPKLIERLKHSGRSEEAEQLWKFGIEPGGSTAKPW